MRDRGVAKAPNCYLASVEPVLERSVPANKRRWQLDFFKSIPPSIQLGTDIDACVKREQKFARSETHLAGLWVGGRAARRSKRVNLSAFWPPLCSRRLISQIFVNHIELTRHYERRTDIADT